MRIFLDKDWLERFWGHVNKDGPIPPHLPELGQCWIWTAAINGAGYGVFWTGDKVETAHRLAWEIYGRPLPKRKKNGRARIHVLHHCDNRSCVRNTHLFSGTHRDNMLDSASKMRHTWGERNGRAVLNEKKVMQLRAADKQVRTAKKQYIERIKEWRFLVRSLNIKTSTARRVASGRLWKHIPFVRGK